MKTGNLNFKNAEIVFHRKPRIQNFKTTQFARIHASSQINIEKNLNRPITKFYNSDDVNAIAAELRLT